jgi:crossover junction endonuclease MUS81
MWEYAGQVLDYVVERKKADDLMSSIVDGRYKEQKYRLKNSTIGNVFYLYEGHLTGSYAKQERSVATALLNTRVKDRFKVVEVNTITETLKFLNFVTQSIRSKLTFEQSIACLGTL